MVVRVDHGRLASLVSHLGHVATRRRHLAPDWIYAPDDGPPEPPIDRTPAAETLAHLRAYARAGDFPSLLDIAAELAPAYPAFADVVARRARAFDAQGVLRVCGEGEMGLDHRVIGRTRYLSRRERQLGGG